MSGYTDAIRRWAADTRRAGILSDADGIGEVGLEAGVAGNRLAVRFALKVEGDRVRDVRYQVFGCGFTLAACAAAAELADGARTEAIQSIAAARVNTLLGGLPGDRGYCAELAVEALQSAIKSLRVGRRVEAAVAAAKEHGPRVSPDHPVYADLIGSPRPDGVSHEDRHLFACLLAVAGDEPFETAAALGVNDADLDDLRTTFFPSATFVAQRTQEGRHEIPPEPSDDILSLLLSYAAPDAPRASIHLVRILAARAAHPGHLWVAMGLFERRELTDAIRRHLPALATANTQKMRWKRYLYKQVCDLNGGVMCKAPNCGECSDHALCFPG